MAKEGFQRENKVTRSLHRVNIDLKPHWNQSPQSLLATKHSITVFDRVRIAPVDARWFLVRFAVERLLLPTTRGVSIDPEGLNSSKSLWSPRAPRRSLGLETRRHEAPSFRALLNLAKCLQLFVSRILLRVTVSVAGCEFGMNLNRVRVDRGSGSFPLRTHAFVFKDKA